MRFYLTLLFSLALLTLSACTPQTDSQDPRKNDDRTGDIIIALGEDIGMDRFEEIVAKANELLSNDDLVIRPKSYQSLNQGPFEGNPFAERDTKRQSVESSSTVSPSIIGTLQTRTNTVELCAGGIGIVETSIEERALNEDEVEKVREAVKETLDEDVAYGVDGISAHSGDTSSQRASSSEYLEAIGALETREAGFVGKGVTIAVIDTGVSEKEQFGGRLLTDLDYDFVDMDDDAADESADGHGTGIALLAAGDKFGVAPGASVLPVRVCSTDKSGNSTCWTSDVILGTCYALVAAERDLNGAANLSINLSLGGENPTAILADILKDANDLGTTASASAGNDGATGVPHYPAAYSSAVAPDGLLGVGAVQFNGNTWEAWPNSTPGTYIDIAAPHTSPLTGGTGSSYSTGLSSGSAAVLRGLFPSRTAAELETCIWLGAQEPFYPSPNVGEGMLNIAQAVTKCSP